MSPTILKRKENLPVNLNKLVWVYWKLLGFSFILTDTRNVICTLHLWCPLDKGHKCLLCVLFMVFAFSYFRLILLYIYFVHKMSQNYLWHCKNYKVSAVCASAAKEKKTTKKYILQESLTHSILNVLVFQFNLMFFTS